MLKNGPLLLIFPQGLTRSAALAWLFIDFFKPQQPDPPTGANYRQHMNLIISDYISSRAVIEMLKIREYLMYYWMSRRDHWLKLDHYGDIALPSCKGDVQEGLRHNRRAYYREELTSVPDSII